MPRYTFKLCDDDDGVEDNIGVSLPNAARSRGKPYLVAERGRKVMRDKS